MRILARLRRALPPSAFIPFDLCSSVVIFLRGASSLSLWFEADGLENALSQLGLGFDLHLVVADEVRDFDQRVGRAHLAKVAAVDAGGGFPLAGIFQIDARAHDVGEGAAEGGDAGG